MKKIMYIISSAEGGIRKHFFDLLENSKFANRNICGIIYPENQMDSDFIEKKQVLEKKTNALKINIKKNPSISDIKNIVKIVDFIQKKSPDIIHAHGAKAGLYLRIATIFLKLNIKSIYSPHGGSFHKGNRGKLSKLIVWIENKLSKRTDYFVFESNYAKEIFEAEVKTKEEKITIIKNAVSVQNKKNEEIEKFINEKKKEGKKIVSIVGKVRHLKGQDLIYEIAKKNKNIYFILVGGVENTYVENFKLNELSNIKLWGDESDTTSFYLHSDLIACPSRAETFGYVALEAIINGAKVVASDIPAFYENLRDVNNIWFFKTNNTNDLEEKIHRALEEKKHAQNINIKQIFSPEKFGKEFDAFYKKI